MSGQEWIMVLGMAAVTFAVRYPPLALVGRMRLSESVLEAMKFIPPAILAAIVTPTVLLTDGQQINLSYTNSYLVASVAAILVSWRTKNLLLTIVVGMTTFWLWRWLLIKL